MINLPTYRAKKIDSDDYIGGEICYLGTLSINFPDSINTNSEKVWYNLEEISNIIKDYENGKVETN